MHAGVSYTKAACALIRQKAETIAERPPRCIAKPHLNVKNVVLLVKPAPEPADDFVLLHHVGVHVRDEVDVGMHLFPASIVSWVLHG